jgi:hypothetical protein
MALGGLSLRDASSRLRTATRRAKSDVANKLVSMFLHELSRLISTAWEIRVDGEIYESLVREHFANRCPYCGKDLSFSEAVIEHLDGMNRLRGGLHVPGNVLVACAKCNSEKRRDDSLRALSLAATGWESFLSHDGCICVAGCRTCAYWVERWPDLETRSSMLAQNRRRIKEFRNRFLIADTELANALTNIPGALIALYTDCQAFAEREIKQLLEQFSEASRKLQATELISIEPPAPPVNEDSRDIDSVTGTK